MSQSLIAALQNPALYPHPVDGFKVIETHISSILDIAAVRRSFVDATVARYSLTLGSSEDMNFTATQREIAHTDEGSAQDFDLPSSGKVSRTWLEKNFLGRELMYNGIAVTRRR